MDQKVEQNLTGSDNPESNIESTQNNGVANQGQIAKDKAHNLETPASREGKPFERLDAALEATSQPMSENDGGEDSCPVIFSDSTSGYNAHFLVVEDRKVLLAEPHVENALLKFANTPVAQLIKGSPIEVVLQDALNIYGEYDKQVSFGENVQNGIATVYRIQEGMFLKRLRDVVEEKVGKRQWVNWVEKNIRHKTYRVIRQYIQMAETPNVKHYAPLGKEVLAKLIAMLKSNKQLYGKDPIGRFLTSHGITYNPKIDQGSEHLENMRVIRVAMNYQKIMDAKLEASITRNMIERLADQGKSVTQALIHELLTAKDEGNDMAAHMDAILNDNGNLQGLKNAEEKRAAVQNAFKRFSKLAKEIADDDVALEGINLEQVQELLEKLNDLESILEDDGQDDEQNAPEVVDVTPSPEIPTE